MNERLSDKLSLLPALPGVYKMYDEAGTVIYVGKAKNLKNRVRQYFQSSKNHTPKVQAMVSHVADFETIVVHSETEAFSLESNLIKEFLPKYNILLKDDKHFPYFRIDLSQDFPRIEIVRRIKQDKATYIGPFVTGLPIQEEWKLIHDLYPIRHCKKNLKAKQAKRERPCLMYHIGKCCAPCSGNVSKEQYHAYLKEIRKLLDGKATDLIPLLTERMMELSEQEEYERAAAVRDKIKLIKANREKQVAISTANLSCDVFAAGTWDGLSLVFALYVRSGKIVGTHAFRLDGEGEETNSAILSAFLTQYYGQTGVELPSLLLVPTPLEDADALSLWLSERKGRKVELKVPVRGEKRMLVALAEKNCQESLEKQSALKRRAWERGEGALAELSALLGLDAIPSRIECFDTSHLMGTHTVSSMVVFTDGQPDRNAYRHYRIRGETDGDDLLSLREALTRRFSKGAPYPDLLLLDGGKTQLQVALSVLDEWELSYLPCCALAESEDWLYLPNEDAPIVLPPHSAPKHLVQRIRDEAHRTAISYHRQQRSKSLLYSRLDDIPNIGEKRKRALFDAFLTLDAIEKASLESLASVKGMSRPAAEAVYEAFHPTESPSL